MNLDDLISKYLDGELKPHEDEELRSQIAQSADAKYDFDSAVILSAACREDGKSINAPAQFLEETESKILMKILADKPIRKEAPVYNLSWKKQLSMAAVFAIIMFIGFARISDLSLFNYKPMLLSMFEEEKSRISSDVQINLIAENKDNGSISVPSDITEKKYYKNEETIKKVKPVYALSKTDNSKNIASLTFKQQEINKNSFEEGKIITDLAVNANPDKSIVYSDLQTELKKEIPDISFTRQTDNAENNNSVLPSKPTNIQFNEGSLNNIQSAYSENGGNWKPSSARQSIQSGSSLTPLQLSKFDFYPVRTDIQLSSFFGSDVGRYGLNVDKESVISHFSESIAYPVNKENTIGLEMGYTSYNYNDILMVKTPVSIGSGTLESIEVTNPGDEDKIYINLPVTFKRSKQIVWGSAFYERSLFQAGDFSVRGRLGFGASNDGLLSFCRLFGKYQIIPGLALTVGADGRLFKAKINKDGRMTDLWRGTTSLIYGFQLSF